MASSGGQQEHLELFVHVQQYSAATDTVMRRWQEVLSMEAATHA